MDLARLIQFLLGQQEDLSPDPGPNAWSRIYSDSQGYPPQWYLDQRNPQIGALMRGFSSPPGQYNQKEEYESYRNDLLPEILNRYIESTRKKRGML